MVAVTAVAVTAAEVSAEIVVWARKEIAAEMATVGQAQVAWVLVETVADKVMAAQVVWVPEETVVVVPVARAQAETAVMATVVLLLVTATAPVLTVAQATVQAAFTADI